MTRSPSVFAVEPASDGPGVLERLARHRTTRLVGEETLREVCLDSHDWRLRRRGLALVERRGRWHLEGRGDLSAPAPRRPGFAWDLEPGPLRAELERLLGVRRLLPRLRVERRRRRMDVLDGEEKTVARIVLERGHAQANGSAAGSLADRLEVHGLRGYDEAARDLGGFLERQPDVTSDGETQLERALAAAGVGSPVQHEARLAATDSAEQATRRVLAALLETVEANRPGVVEDVDTEFLHDLRVAVRRSRSVLDQLDGVFPESRRAPLSKELAWLGSATGPLRDLDVFLLALEPRRAGDDALIDQLGPLYRFLAERRRTVHRTLVRALRGKRYQQLIADLGELVSSPVAADAAPHAARSARSLVGERVSAVRRKMQRRGRRVAGTTPAATLHRVRIQGKKLRYLLDGFRGLWSEDEVRSVLRDLKKLQTLLGDFNDADVQRAWLSDLAGEMPAEWAASGREPEELAAVLLAMGRMVERLDARQVDLRRRFAARFEAFFSADSEARFRALLSGGAA